MYLNPHDDKYLGLVAHVLETGEDRDDRTGVGTRGIFGSALEFDLQAGFPILTTKSTHFHSVVVELLWFLRGDTNIKYLKDNKCSIWDEWADENGDLGPVYGKQWRSFPRPDGGSVDQIKNVVEGLRADPFSRRHLVVAWNPGEIDEMALPPCHVLFQFYVDTKGRLSCQLYQRSVDIGLGLPFNIASYALLTHMIAHELGLKVGKFRHIGGDVHIYQNHIDALYSQMERDHHPAPELQMSFDSMFTARPEDFKLVNYKHSGKLPMEVAV